MKIKATFFAAAAIFFCGGLRAQRSPLGIVSFHDSTRSVQAGLIASVTTDYGKGLQLAGFSNMAATPFKGIQLAGISNISCGVERGLQLAGLLNVSSGYMRGAQLAPYNYADSLNGSQLGFINVALTHPKGWQVGLVNVTRDTVARKLGLVNVNPNTAIDYLFYLGSATKLNGAVRFRNHSTYSILAAGTHYMGLDKRFSGALSYRLGQYFPVSERLSLSGDVGLSHIETFEQHNANKPERLYSLQARLSADWQLNRQLGLFAAVGYADTRYYHRARHYRNGLLVEAGLTLRHRRGGHNDNWFEQEADDEESTLSDSLMARLPHPRPWTAAAEAAGVNVFVHCLDRFVLNKDYAHTTLHSLHRNFKTGFVWDNDEFMTNNFGHPYHGNLYFNSARSQGLNFWQSAPYALGGSLMWELLGETEPPALNDVFATTMGGICIGEMTHRISDIFLNDRTRGFNRFLREAAATIVDPIKGLRRIVSGDAWRIRHTNYLHHDRSRLPIDCSLSVGDRYLADDGAMFRGEQNPYLNFYMEYGNALDDEGRTGKPYDFFDAEITFGLSGNQPLINALHLLGRVWSWRIYPGRDIRAEVGFYQHFNYFNSEPVKDGSDLTPYRIGEAASVGPGAIFSFPATGSLARLEQRVFLSGILLGGTKSDYYSFQERDYNMGSGFSIKSKTHLEMRHFGRFILHARYFRLFTWKGYEQKDLTSLNLSYLNAQGDKGNAKLLVITPLTEIDLGKRWSLLVSASYYSRSTHYKYYNDVKADTFEGQLGLTYHFL